MHQKTNVDAAVDFQEGLPELTGESELQSSLAEQDHLAMSSITRRTFLATAATVALAGCAQIGETPKPTPTPLPPFTLGRGALLFADNTVPALVADAAKQLINNVAGIPDAGFVFSLDLSPDLILTYGKPPAGYTATPIGDSPLAVVTHLRVPIDNISKDQLGKVLSGTVNNWNEVGAPYSLPVQRFALQGLALPADISLANAKTLPDVNALLEALRAQKGSIALVPVEVADWSVRNMGIDDLYPAQGRGDSVRSPFAPLKLQIAAANKLMARGLDLKKLAAQLKPVLASSTPTFDMVVAPDIILGRGVNNKMVAYNDYLYPFRKVRDEFMSADWRVANLECTITDLVPVPTDNYTFTFITKKRAVEGLVYAGLQSLTVANNHADNGGIDAFLDMLNTLHEKKIATCGGGNNLAEARTPIIQTVKGTRVALLGYNGNPPGGSTYATANSAGIAPIDLDTLQQDLVDARKNADVVIPFFHWGIEYTKVPTNVQQKVARQAIDWGADMVLGSHPHWVQATESYKGRLIVYGLGNFIFDQDWSRETLEGCMLHMYWRGTTLAGVRFVPYLIKDRCQPNIVSHAEAVDTFDRIWSGTDILASGQFGPEPEP